MKIELKNLVLMRPGEIRAIDDVSFIFDSRRSPAFAILGGNGAGKSTLLESIPGLIPIASGSIAADGLNVEKKNLTQLRRRIGMIFQNSDDQLFSQTVAEDVAFGPANLKLSSSEVQARVQSALTQMEIVHLANREITCLSGGEKRRVALAGVLAMHPDAILLDEPTSMLDPRACRELAEHLNGLPSLKIVATHDLMFASRVCPECVILKGGKIAAAGKTAALLTQHELLLECGLE